MLKGYHIAALCVARIHDQEHSDFVFALNRYLAKFGWRVMCFTTDSDLYSATVVEPGELQIFDLIDYDIVDSVIFFGSTALSAEIKKKHIELAKQSGKPVFIVDEIIDGCINIRFDYTAGFEKVVRHVIEEHGVRDIHFMAGFQNNPFSLEREAVVAKVAAEYSIPFGKEQISYGDFWSIPAITETRKLIAENRLPKAMICANDGMAIAVSTELIANGYKVPEDVIVTGFDGNAGIYYSDPKITSCRCDYPKLAEALGKAIIDLQNGIMPASVINIIPELIIQESCGCVSELHTSSVDYINELTNTFQRFHGEGRSLDKLSMRLQGCQTTKELCQTMYHPLFYDMICVLKNECLDERHSPLDIRSTSTYGESLFVIYDSVRPDINYEHSLMRRDLLPRMEALLKEGRPLILIALNYLNIPLGYLCFHFSEDNRQNLLKTGQIAACLNMAIGGYRNMRYQYHMQQMIEERYRYDAVTGLNTRSSFLQHYDAFLKERHPEQITIVMCDLDDLKFINDDYNHSEGDAALSVVADALHNACYDGLCCRYGGDEMVAILTKPCEPKSIIESIQDYIIDYNLHSGKPYKVSSSIGVYQSKDSDFQTLFREADKLMYQDKKLKKKHRKRDDKASSASGSSL